MQADGSVGFIGGSFTLSPDLFQALARVVRADPTEDPSVPLRVAAREAARLCQAALSVVRMPSGSAELLEVRVPAEAKWPSARLLEKWHVEAARRKRPLELGPRDLPPRLAMRKGVVLPIFSACGEIGSIALFWDRQVDCSLEGYGKVAILVQGAMARTESVRMRQNAEMLTASKVRRRLAREIHDGPLQTLSGSVLRLRFLRDAAKQPTREALQDLERELRQAIGQTRALIRTLRMARPDGTLEERVQEALTRLKQARGLSWSLQWREPRGLPVQVTDEVFRVINEALANVYRHASARHVEVLGRVRDGVFEVIVRDDGIGFDVAKALRRDIRSLSFGLMGMQERISALGGTLTLRSQAGRGTRVLINLPLRPPASTNSVQPFQVPGRGF